MQCESSQLACGSISASKWTHTAHFVTTTLPRAPIWVAGWMPFSRLGHGHDLIRRTPATSLMNDSLTACAYTEPYERLHCPRAQHGGIEQIWSLPWDRCVSEVVWLHRPSIAAEAGRCIPVCHCGDGVVDTNGGLNAASGRVDSLALYCYDGCNLRDGALGWRRRSEANRPKAPRIYVAFQLLYMLVDYPF
jgi:hypothetical protein